MQLSKDIDDLPWQPIAPGYDMKVLRGSDSDDDTRTLLLRLEPGVVIARHRHDGEIHALNLRGTRRLSTGEVVPPGGYVYEPPGNVDSWEAIGDEPVLVFIVARGAMEYLEDDGRVRSRYTTSSVTAAYARCRAAR